MDNNIELKPCPFCGGVPELEASDGGRVWWVYIQCISCGARVLGGTTSGVPQESNAYYRACCKWNLRAYEK